MGATVASPDSFRGTGFVMARVYWSVTFSLLFAAAAANAQDWLQWRGPTGDHHAPAGATAPSEWSETNGIAWRTAIPGQGHSSPTLVGSRIYLTTADAAAQTQSLLILDRATGKLLREVLVHQGGLPARIHPNNTHASPTVASDGSRVYTLFNNNARAWLTALSLDGEQIWQRDVAGFDPQQYEFGFGSSPRIAGGVLLFASEYDGPGSAIYAVDPETGADAWQADRPDDLSYSTPAVATLGGTTQLLMSGNDLLASYDARTGATLWSIEGSSRATCGTMVWDESLGLVFASGGYPNAFTCAVRTKGEPEIVWQNGVKCYEQSMLTLDGYLYGVSDRGVAYCWRCEDGAEMWKERLAGRYSSSPVLVDGKIYVTNEGGTTYVFRATPNGYEGIATNQLGTSGFATPTPADGRLYHRYGVGEGADRKEFVVAIGG